MDTKNVGIVCVTIAFVAIILGAYVFVYANNRTAMTNGYEQGTLQGYSTPQWVKIKE